MKNFFKQGHFILEDTTLSVCVYNVKHLLQNFVPGNELSAKLNPNDKCPYITGISSWSTTTNAPDTLFLLTSGTTGTPKVIEKNDMSKYMLQKGGRGSPEDSWILTYHPYRWAGISTIAHTIKNGSKLIIPTDFSTAGILGTAVQEQASHISLTPSMFRKMMIEGADYLKVCKFKQITFGGEIASQAVLDHAKYFFPNARISHVYASTEHGDICSASDGREGFHESKFKNHDFTEDGELVVGYLPTGDFWEKIGERYYFIGRDSDVVNVGGNKMSLSFVENRLMSLFGVQQARAKVESSPILGNIITAEYVGLVEPRDVMTAARVMLPKYALAKVFKVDNLELSAAGKIKR